MKATEIKRELIALSDPVKREFLPRFFKAGPGEYGEGDLFLGVTVPKQRMIVKKYRSLPMEEIRALLYDEYHECRLTALLFLVRIFGKSKSEEERKEIYDFYIEHKSRINNWDLVDLSARDIVGGYLWNKPRDLLYRLARTDHLWSQRISIIATCYFIKKKDFTDTFSISDILLNHPHDLIHKAVGWMLREAGKEDMNALLSYLTDHNRYSRMPRTMLRYAIEKFPEPVRIDFLKGHI